MKSRPMIGATPRMEKNLSVTYPPVSRCGLPLILDQGIEGYSVWPTGIAGPVPGVTARPLAAGRERDKIFGGPVGELSGVESETAVSQKRDEAWVETGFPIELRPPRGSRPLCPHR